MKVCLNILASALFCLSGVVYAQFDNLEGFEKSTNVKVIRGDDGSRSVYMRDKDEKTMKRLTYSPDGILSCIIVYSTGNWKQLTSCKVYDGRSKELYKIAYGYDPDARLVEEQMFDSRRIDRRTGKHVLVRRFIYLYDESGNRSKPICIVLAEDKNADIIGVEGTVPAEDPFARENN